MHALIPELLVNPRSPVGPQKMLLCISNMIPENAKVQDTLAVAAA